MSLRGTKRASGVRSEETGKCKRRRTEPEDALWQLPPVSDLKMSSIYNRSAPEAPAELFRFVGHFNFNENLFMCNQICFHVAKCNCQTILYYYK